MNYGVAFVYLDNQALSWTGTVPNDIRFTKSDGTTELDYWIESSDADTAQVWIEFDSIPASPDDGTFYLYYGDDDATDASNGADTFPLFDDFSGDLSLWDITGTVNIVSGICQLTGANSAIDSKTQFGLGYSVRTYAKTVTIGSYGTAAQWRNQPETVYARLTNNSAVSAVYEIANDQIGATVTTLEQSTAYHIREISRIASNNVKYCADNALLTTRTTNPTSADRASVRGEGKDIHIDWILVRKITAIEPTWEDWGGEETAGFAHSFGTIIG